MGSPLFVQTCPGPPSCGSIARVDPARLRSIPLFEGLSRRDLENVARYTDEVDVDEGSHVVDEGDFAYEFFAIESGTADVLHGDAVVAQLGEGDFFGEIALLDHGERTASVVATSPMIAIVMTGGQFRLMDREQPEIAQRVRTAVEQRREADRQRAAD